MCNMYHKGYVWLFSSSDSVMTVFENNITAPEPGDYILFWDFNLCLCHEQSTGLDGGAVSLRECKLVNSEVVME